MCWMVTLFTETLSVCGGWVDTSFFTQTRPIQVLLSPIFVLLFSSVLPIPLQSHYEGTLLSVQLFLSLRAFCCLLRSLLLSFSSPSPRLLYLHQKAHLAEKLMAPLCVTDSLNWASPGKNTHILSSVTAARARMREVMWPDSFTMIGQPGVKLNSSLHVAAFYNYFLHTSHGNLSWSRQKSPAMISF